jgi:predicted permease
MRARTVVESVSQDVTYALRAMGRAPGFSVAAVATIALGIGANTLVFSLLNALILQPLDAARPAELVRVYTSEGHAPRHDGDRFGASSYADYLDLGRSDALAGLIAFAPLSALVDLNGIASPVPARLVSENYFMVLDRPLLHGGWSSDSARGSLDVVVSHRFWTSRLGGADDVVGRPLVVNGRRARVVGVTSPRFKGIEPAHVDLYFPVRSAVEMTGRAGFLTDRGERSIRLLGRLANGVTPAAAEAALDGVMRGLGEQFPASNARRTISVRPARSILPLELMGPGVFPSAGLVFGASLVMLAIAGVNAAAVLMARTTRRRRELAVRQSIGAGPVRLVRQLTTESVVLALAASVVVVGLVSLLPVLANWLEVPPSVQPGVDVTVLGYAVGVALGFGILFGLTPALAGLRADVVESLRGGDADSRPSTARTQQALVCAQLAMSMLLLVIAGAMLDSLSRQQRVDPGFTAAGLVIATFEDPSGISAEARHGAFAQLAVERLAGVPGVVSVSTASMAPLTSDGVRSTIHIPDYTGAPGEDMQVATVTAGPDYFKTLRIPLRRGRELTWSDRDPRPRIIVNESMARRYWGGRDPVGAVVRLGGREGVHAEVIGVAADARFRSLAEAPLPLYVVQRAAGGGETLLVRTRDDAAAMLLTVRGLMSRNDVPLTLVQLRTMEDVLRTSLAVTRALSDTVTAIGILAVLLAAVGLYGVVSYVMTSRTREFGVRVALGASPRSLARLVLGYGMRLTVIGGAAGMILGFAALRLISAMLFGSWSVGPIAAVAGMVVGAVMLVACAIPAAKAAGIAPARVLRSD